LLIIIHLSIVIVVKIIHPTIVIVVVVVIVVIHHLEGIAAYIARKRMVRIWRNESKFIRFTNQSIDAVVIVVVIGTDYQQIFRSDPLLMDHPKAP
jgi:hypothetical protein